MVIVVVRMGYRFLLDLRNNTVIPFILTMTLWTNWCLLMAFVPELAAPDNLLRAVIRIAFVLLPAWWYMRINISARPMYDLLREHLRAGWVWGALVSVFVVVVASIYFFLILGKSWEMPVGLVQWGHWILLGPFVEEVLFRGVMYRELRLRLRPWPANLLTSFCFVLIHLPPMLLLQDASMGQILTVSVQIFGLSVLFTYAFERAQSIWGSLLPHWMNNLLSLGLS